MGIRPVDKTIDKILDLLTKIGFVEEGSNDSAIGYRSFSYKGYWFEYNKETSTYWFTSQSIAAYRYIYV